MKLFEKLFPSTPKVKTESLVTENDIILVEKIHAEIDSAQERLLTEAKSIIASIDPKLPEVAARLKAIGFSNTPVAKHGEQVDKECNEAYDKAKTIEYYTRTYRFLKFLTEDELDRICKKYNLIYAPVVNYIKDVPIKNLLEIEKAQVLSYKDSVQKKYKLVVKDYYSGVPKEIKEFITKGLYFDFPATPSDHSVLEAIRTQYGYVHPTFNSFIYSSGTSVCVDKTGLYIAAPQSHFDLKDLNHVSKYGFFKVEEIEIKDPIVFRYVTGGIQVLTKWGVEGNDPALVLPINN
jgi:hypothetical protein